MPHAVRVVVVEGKASGAERLEAELRRSDLTFETLRVATRAAFVSALKRAGPDAILCDLAPPGLAATDALEIARRSAPEAVFLVIAGPTDDAAAAAAMAAGADDYVLADRMARLGLAIGRAIERRRVRRESVAALHDIFAAAQSTRTLADLCAELHAIVRRLMPADVFHFAILNLETGLLEFPYFSDAHGGVPRPIAPGSGLTGRLLRVGRPILVSGAELLEMERRGEATRGGERSSQWLGVPLTISGRVIGAMVLESYARSPVYGDEQLNLLDSISIAVAQVIERKRAEMALRDSEAKYRLLFNASNDAVFVHALVPDGASGRFIEVNEVACRRLGYSRDELLKMCPAEIDSEETRAAGPAMVTKLVADRHAVWEGAHVAKDGHTIPVEISNHLFELDGKQVILSTVRDITERKRLEAKLRQMQRTEAVGNLAGGVAHEFNNLLQTMLAVVETLRLRRADAQATAAELGGLEEQIRRGARLTRQLLIFARGEIAAPEIMDLNEVARNGARMVCPLLGEKIALALDLAAGPVQLRADRAQLEQLLINLALNAGDAMPAGGTLTVRTGGERDRVWLEVEDTGTGILPAIRGRVFDPFFTTKEPGRGTGLGLPVVLGIATAHGGEVAIESEVGAGTAVRVTFPAADGGAPPTPPIAPCGDDELPRGRGERVLLVEDEAAARQSLAETLATLGYDVTPAATSEEVAGLADATPFDLLLTEVKLPGRSGLELASGLRARDPRLRVILMSGYTEEVIGPLAQQGGRGVLEKPFDLATLALAVREALDRDGSVDQARPDNGPAR